MENEKQEKSFIDDFLNKTSSLEISQMGMVIVDYVKILDALGIGKEEIIKIIKNKIKGVRGAFQPPPEAPK